MDKKTPLTPVITLEAPQFKAIDTCACCGVRAPGEVMHLRLGWHDTPISNGSSVSTMLCNDCLRKLEVTINKHLVTGPTTVDISPDSRINLTNGVLSVTCQNGHSYEVNPINYDASDGSCLYGSSADFCRVCDVPIR